MSNLLRRRVKSVLLDLSGTLHVEDTVIPGAQEAVSRLRQDGIKVKFVTNTTKESLSKLHYRLEELKFDVGKNEIFSSLSAARRLIERDRLRPLLILDPRAEEDFQGLDTTNPNAVVMALAPDSFNYETMNEAFRLVVDGAKLIAVNKARYFKKKDGLWLGTGPFVQALEYSTGQQAQVVGKPNPDFFLEALSTLEEEPQHAVMIGDDVRDDVLGAMDTGMAGILVKTGKYRPGDESVTPRAPTAVCDSVVQAADLILRSNSAQHAHLAHS